VVAQEPPDILDVNIAQRLGVATTTLVILSHYTNISAAKFLSMMGGFAVNFSMAHFVIFRPLPVPNET
jgi:hypothetical protein